MKPVLVLYSKSDDAHDDAATTNLIEVERIPLHEYQSKDALHTLLLNLGFTPKSEMEQQQVRENAQLMQFNERLDHHKRIEYYKWRTIYVNEFRTNVMGMTLEEYQERTKYQRWTCHPSGPIPDMLNDQYDHINLNIAGAYKEDRYLYPKQYLENVARKKV